jgi:hypothetical protein
LRVAVATSKEALESGGGENDFAYYGTELIDAMELERNKVIAELIVLAKAVHEAKDDRLVFKRASLNWMWDTTQIVSTGLASVTGSEATARSLAAFATGIAGIQESMDKRFFHQQTASALLSLMNADRVEKMKPIVVGMTLSAVDYPLERALDDYVDYFLAGGMTDALRQLSADAAAKEREANQSLIKLQGLVDENIKRIQESEAAEQAKREQMNADLKALIDTLVEQAQTFAPGASMPGAAVPDAGTPP